MQTLAIAFELFSFVYIGLSVLQAQDWTIVRYVVCGWAAGWAGLLGTAECVWAEWVGAQDAAQSAHQAEPRTQRLHPNLRLHQIQFRLKSSAAPPCRER